MKAGAPLAGTIGIAVALAGVLMASSLFLFVLPGYYLFLIADYPLGGLFGPFHGDNWLPIAMQFQLLWPPVLPVAVWVAGKIAGRSGMSGLRGRNRTGLAVFLAAFVACSWGVVLATLLHWKALHP